MKRKFYTEAAYLFGLILLASGAALMERADLGMSMVVAPAYLVYLKVSTVLPWFSFGMAEYCFQALLLLVLAVVLKRLQRRFLFSFVTAFVYGNILDGAMKCIGLFSGDGWVLRLVLFVMGMLFSAVGVSLLFHTYIAPEVYELFVKEISAKYGRNIHVVKTVYDCCSCMVAVIMSFAFFGFLQFRGVKAGTILCALVNGSLIGFCSRFFERHFDFCDGLHFRNSVSR